MFLHLLGLYSRPIQTVQLHCHSHLLAKALSDIQKPFFFFFFADTEYAGSTYVQYWSLYKNARTLHTYPIKEFGFICNLSKVFNYIRKKEVTEFYNKETNTFDLKRKTVPFLFKTSRIPLISFSLFRCEDYVLLIICLTLNTSLLIHVTVPKSSSSMLRNFILRF